MWQSTEGDNAIFANSKIIVASLHQVCSYIQIHLIFHCLKIVYLTSFVVCGECLSLLLRFVGRLITLRIGFAKYSLLLVVGVLIPVMTHLSCQFWPMDTLPSYLVNFFFARAYREREQETKATASTKQINSIKQNLKETTAQKKKIRPASYIKWQKLFLFAKSLWNFCIGLLGKFELLNII